MLVVVCRVRFRNYVLKYSLNDNNIFIKYEILQKKVIIKHKHKLKN